MKRNFTLLFLLWSAAFFAQTIGITPFASGLSGVVEITHAGDARLFVVQQSGSIKIVNSNGTVNATSFLTLNSSIVLSGGERGLLGLAFHPNYATNGYFYVNYTRAGDGATVVARYTVSSDPNVANPSSAVVLLTVAQPFSNHNGGTIKFGPDGYLYVGMGDGGSGGDPGNRAQNINENLGKMLRLDVDSGSPYAIPAGNPFVGVAGNDEIWAIGLRNPWKFSFNRLNGDLWIADVGQNEVEEINKVSNPLTPGLNFGWRCYEGTVPYNTSGCPAAGTLTMPLGQYTHTATGGCSITGGYAYTGTTYPNFANKYFFADYCHGKINYMTNTGAITFSPSIANLNNPTTFGEDVNGELYIASNSNSIYKIIDTSLAVDQFTRSGFTLAPNPASANVTITPGEMTFPAQLQIFDLAGKLLLDRNIEHTNSLSISTERFQTGLYLVTIEDNSGNRYSSKLIIQ
ncbi:MAG TPA: PQQ-dependent sugar dehydrogenase [Flavobacterium sp.]|jgi:glucose/arabinose dehydrogenase